MIINGINTFIRGLNKIQIPDWVPGVGGKGFHINELPRLKVGLDYVPEDDFPAVLHKGEAVLTREENETYRQAKSRAYFGNNSNSDSRQVGLLERLIDILLAYFPQFKELMNQPIVADDGTIIAHYAPGINEELRKIQDKEERGS